jgi:hypothetical protein
MTATSPNIPNITIAALFFEISLFVAEKEG